VSTGQRFPIPYPHITCGASKKPQILLARNSLPARMNPSGHAWKLGGRIIPISVLLLFPCFWQARIEAGDLRSHLYNAWLTQLVMQGQAPGLWVTHQWTNVLFHFLLSGFGHVFGLYAAERIAVSLAVLIFFWGAFAFVFAATRRPPWLLVPLIAAMSYGWTFQEGVFNYYISVGLALRGRRSVCRIIP
jgi:hypothetical protein